MGSANRDADFEDLAADLAQAGLDKRQVEAELQRMQRAAVEQHEAMQLLQVGSRAAWAFMRQCTLCMQHDVSAVAAMARGRQH